MSHLFFTEVNCFLYASFVHSLLAHDSCIFFSTLLLSDSTILSIFAINSNLYFLKLWLLLSISSSINVCFSSAVSCLQFSGLSVSFFCNCCYPSFICRVAKTISGWIYFWGKTLYDFEIYFPMLSKYVTWSPSGHINTLSPLTLSHFLYVE